MKYVKYSNSLWHLADAQWTTYLQDMADGTGHPIPPGQLLTKQVINVTDMDAAEARHLLNNPDDFRSIN